MIYNIKLILSNFFYYFREQADIVFLQEVVPESAAYLLEKMSSNYHCFFGNEVGYFVGTLLKKSSVSNIDNEIIEYPITRMMRNILKVNVSIIKIYLQNFIKKNYVCSRLLFNQDGREMAHPK